MSQQTTIHTSHNILVLHTQKQYEHSSKHVTQKALLVTRSSICDTGCTWKAAIQVWCTYEGHSLFKKVTHKTPQMKPYLFLTVDRHCIYGAKFEYLYISWC